jgi:hypothetical protein
MQAFFLFEIRLYFLTYAIIGYIKNGVCKLYRDEVIELMSNTVNDYNRGMISMGMMSADQVEAFIKENQPQLEYMNGLLYDTLKQHGVIN